MAITLNSGFDVNVALPLDSRTTAADITARDAIASGRRYEMMVVAVLDSDGAGTPMNYQLQGGITNTDWVEYGTGGSGIAGTEILYAQDFEKITALDFNNLDPAWTFNIVTPLNGERTLKVDHTADAFCDLTFPVPVKFRGKLIKVSLDVKSDAVASKLQFWVYSGATPLVDFLDLTYNNTKSTRNTFYFTMPTAGTTLNVGIDALTSAAAFSFVDDLLFEAVDFPVTGTVALIKTTNYTVTLYDSVVLGNATSGNILFTLPSAASAFANRKTFTFMKTDTSVNTVELFTTDLINGVSSRIIYDQYNDVVTVVSDGTNYYAI